MLFLIWIILFCIVLWQLKYRRLEFALLFLIFCFFKIIYSSLIRPVSFDSLLLVSVSMITVCVVSLVCSKKRSNLKVQYNLYVSSPDWLYVNGLIIVLMYLLNLLIVWSFQLPLFEAFLGLDPIGISSLRALFTKSSLITLLLNTVFAKMLTPLYFFMLGNRYLSIRKSSRPYLLVLTTLLLFFSISFSEKALLFTNLLMLLLGFIASGQINTVREARALALKSLVFMIFSFVIVSFLSGTVDSLLSLYYKNSDLIFRRLGRVPSLVLDAYTRYPVRDEISLAEARLLPRTIYNYINWGVNDLGWANTYFAAQLLLYQGYLAVMIGSSVLGFVFGRASRFLKYRPSSLLHTIIILDVTLISYYVSSSGMLGLTLIGLILLFFILDTLTTLLPVNY